MEAYKPTSHRVVRRPLALAIQSLSVATASSLLLWTAGGGFDGPQPKVASAATKPEKSSQPNPAVIAPETQERTVKLNYFSAPWEKVFREVAAATDSQLVADRVPSGRFSRRDGTEYTRHDAVRIINKDIEPLGFRLIEKGDFLIVIDLPSQRPRYQPAVVSKENGEDKVVDPNAVSTSPYQRRTQSISRREGSEDEKTSQSSRTRRAKDKSVRQVSHDDEEESESTKNAPRKPSSEETAAPARLQEEQTDDLSQIVFRPRHRTVVDLSKQMYRTFKPRAQLVSHGRDGLPAFRIASGSVQAKEDDKKSSPNPGSSFTIAIDEAGEELLIDGHRGETEAVLKLLRTLDRPFDSDESVQLTASSSYVCQIAGQLPEEIDRLRAAKQQADQFAKRPVDQPLWVAEGNQPAAARNDLREAPRMAAQMNVPPALGDVISNLKGQVEIQPLPDLNAIIVKGAEKDVEQVMKVIRELEKLSEATAPKVHILYLKHVDSESLAELLTTVYERLTKFPGLATQPRQNAAILPITKPNALMIIAPENDLTSILDLAEELDRPVDPATEFQVFHLKTAIAAQVEELITQFYEERKNLGAKVLVIADARANAVIVRAQPRDLDEISALIRKLDRDETAAVSQLKVFPLKNAIASELAAVMNAAIQSVIAPPTASSGGGGGGQGGILQGLNPGQVDEQFKNVKSAVLQFLAVGKDGERQIRSGILADIRITPDSRVNSLIVSASEQSMELIGELIKQLDRPTTTVSEIKVFTLANADAELMVQQLNALFNNQTQQGGGAGNQLRQQLGIALANADDASSSLVPLKFSVDKRTNSVIAVGAAEALQVVEAILLRLDESDLRARQTLVLRLQNSPSTQVANEINQFYSSQRDLTQNDPNLLSSIEQLEREVVVVADTATNSLIVSATPRYFDDIKKMVAKLDEAPRQVIIQALLVEVELANTDEFGVELGFQDSVLFDRSLKDAPTVLTTTTTAPNGTQTTSQTILSQSGQPGFNFNNTSIPLGNNLAGHPSKVGTQGLSNFSLGRVNGDLGFGGLVLSAGSDSVNVLLRALAAHRRIQILSRPQIRALDNQQATIFSGQNVPVVNGFTANGTTGVNTPTVQYRDVGIELNCVPRVTEDGQVFMQVYAQRSQYRNEGVPLTTDVTGRTIESPILDISRAQTTISVQTGQTVVIGGLINARDEQFTNKVPFLGDIPLIGTAFRYDSRSTRRVELLVFLTPRVLGGPCDEETIKEVEMGRLHYIESEAEEMHGPLRALPAPDQMFDENGAPWLSPNGPTTGTVSPPPAPPAKDEQGLQVPPPPEPMEDDMNKGTSVIKDSAVAPASAARIRFTEEDDEPINVRQASIEGYSVTGSGSSKASRSAVKSSSRKMIEKK